ncbi:hypothetical protein KKA27_00950 [Patescibacteria group bacterium]|nr:hypothetical protein [Patescibacteria group bacterium]MBU2633344.1 hypothetical protein [Patescibacteria group bacterium]
MAEATTIENERMMQMQEESKRREEKENTNARVAPKKLSFWKKVREHELILWVAAFFDVLALIPFLSIIFNTIFAGILFVYFFGKKSLGKEMQSGLKTIFLPSFLGTIIDSVFSILPVNTTVALIRIYNS